MHCQYYPAIPYKLVVKTAIQEPLLQRREGLNHPFMRYLNISNRFYDKLLIMSARETAVGDAYEEQPSGRVVDNSYAMDERQGSGPPVQ